MNRRDVLKGIVAAGIASPLSLFADDDVSIEQIPIKNQDYFVKFTYDEKIWSKYTELGNLTVNLGPVTRIVKIRGQNFEEIITKALKLEPEIESEITKVEIGLQSGKDKVKWCVTWDKVLALFFYKDVADGLEKCWQLSLKEQTIESFHSVLEKAIPLEDLIKDCTILLNKYNSTNSHFYWSDTCGLIKAEYGE